jgi:hypothetical protein
LTGVKEDDMKGIQLLVVAVLVVLTVIPGCQGASAEEPDPRDQRIEDLEGDLLDCQTTADQNIADAVATAKAETETRLREEFAQALSEKDDQIVDLQADVDWLTEVNEDLVSVNALAAEFIKDPNQRYVIARVTIDEFLDGLHEAYCCLMTRGSYKDRIELTSLENLEKFLEADPMNKQAWFRPLYDPDDFNLSDEAAFLFKVRWINAGLPGGSLGLLKCDRGEGIHWRNLFVTVEEGKVVFYEVDPVHDTITKVEEQIREGNYCHVFSESYS